MPTRGERMQASATYSSPSIPKEWPSSCTAVSPMSPTPRVTVAWCTAIPPNFPLLTRMSAASHSCQDRASAIFHCSDWNRAREL
jgi:hypothetical protein